MNIHQFLLALRGRFWVFATLAISTVVVAILVSLALPKSYDSTVALLLDHRDEQSLSGPLPSLRERAGFMQTQMDIINSQRVAERVIKDLGLAESQQVKDAFAASDASGRIEAGSARAAQKLKVRARSLGDPAHIVARAIRSRHPRGNASPKAYRDTTRTWRVADEAGDGGVRRPR